MTATTLEHELLDLEQQYWKALQDKDTIAAERLTDFPCIVTGAQGVSAIDRQTFAKMVKDSRHTIDSAELSDVHVRRLTDDVAVVAYNVREELVVEGKPVTLKAADSSTWIRRDGHWACAAHSEVVLGDPFGPGHKAER